MNINHSAEEASELVILESCEFVCNLENVVTR